MAPRRPAMTGFELGSLLPQSADPTILRHNIRDPSLRRAAGIIVGRVGCVGRVVLQHPCPHRTNKTPPVSAPSDAGEIKIAADIRAGIKFL